MRASRTLTTIAVLIATTGLAACGSDDKDADPGTPAASAPATNSSPGDDETDTASGGLVDICTQITDAEITDIVGNPVTRKDVPGGGCSFDQEDLRAPTLAFASSVYDEGNGGFDGAITGITGVLQDSSGAEVSGVGERAFVATGKSPGGSNTQASGVVLFGGNLVQVTLIQGNGLSAAKVKDLTVEALTLAASKG